MFAGGRRPPGTRIGPIASAVSDEDSPPNPLSGESRLSWQAGDVTLPGLQTRGVSSRP